jgi:uncharacterized protein YoxC
MTGDDLRRRLVDSTLLTLWARLASAVGMPAAGFLCVVLIQTLHGLSQAVHDARTADAVFEVRTTTIEREIDALRLRLDRIEADIRELHRAPGR